VRDADAFGLLIDDLYRQHGRIDGVIHGAGIVEDKLVRHKDGASFKRVFDTKVLAAATLCEKLRDDPKFVVFFSSVASAFGNRGQADYAAANDVLDKLAYTLQARVRGRVVSINWGPWAGRGMVSPELEREYSRRGIGLIGLDEGVEALLQELRYGAREDVQVVIMHTRLDGSELAAQRSVQAGG
jgi:NAD(P)-dependent dehydrogenase (short-subunit alcohol dehydrogenase family)